METNISNPNLSDLLARIEALEVRIKPRKVSPRVLEYSPTVSFRCSKELARLLLEKSEALGVTRSDVLRIMMETFLKTTQSKDNHDTLENLSFNDDFLIDL